LVVKIFCSSILLFHLWTCGKIFLHIMQYFVPCVDMLPGPKLGPIWALVSKTTKLWGLEGTLPTLNTKRGRGACWSSGMGLGRGKNFSYSLEPASNQPNKLVSSHFGAPLVLGQAMGNSGFTRPTTARTRGKPPPSLI
jgi:hypothetical protein